VKSLSQEVLEPVREVEDLVDESEFIAGGDTNTGVSLQTMEVSRADMGVLPVQFIRKRTLDLLSTVILNT